MAKKEKSGLDKIDLDTIEEFEAKVADAYDPAKDPKFDLGDICLQTWTAWRSTKVLLYKNTRGVPRKYKVVHLGHTGIPYFKEIDARGRTYGPILLPHRLECIYDHGSDDPKSSWGYSLADWNTKGWIQDGHQLDAILLGQEYQPGADAREKNELFSEIMKHNKSVVVDTSTPAATEAYLRTLKVGDVFWNSNQTYFVVEEIGTNKKGVFTVTAKDNRGRTVHFTHYSCRSRLYRAQPRSYRKEAKE